MFYSRPSERWDPVSLRASPLPAAHLLGRRVLTFVRTTEEQTLHV